MKRLRLLVLGCVLALTAAPAALADKQADPNCWGEATADFAQSAPGALGELFEPHRSISRLTDRDERASATLLVRLVVITPAVLRRSLA